MEDTVEVEILLHVGFMPESHGQYNKVHMQDADVKEAMAEYDRVHGTHVHDTRATILKHTGFEQISLS